LPGPIHLVNLLSQNTQDACAPKEDPGEMVRSSDELVTAAVYSQKEARFFGIRLQLLP
jgi:hypothetical protein